MRSRGRSSLALLTIPAALAIALGASPSATADTIDADPALGYVPVEELSYEAIIRPPTGANKKKSSAFETELALRVALRNASVSPQDAVETLILPRGAELVGMAINEEGAWVEADPSQVMRASESSDLAVRTGRRDPGSVWARPLEPDQPGDLPAVELVAFGLPSQTAVQIELRVRVNPVLRGDRWQLELPRRNVGLPNLVDQRRVIVQGLRAGEGFWIDGSSNAGTPYMVTRAEDVVLVSWPAHIQDKARLGGSLETRPDADGEGGTVRMVLRLGPSRAVAPDHVVLLLDSSRSGSSATPKEAGRVFGELLDSLPKGATFDAVRFARDASPLLASESNGVGDKEARDELSKALRQVQPEQGTDLRAALASVGERLSVRGAKRPLVVIVTDGMLPPSVPSDAVADALSSTLGKQARPELLFVVDDPLLNARGLPADHSVASLAADLGARLSLETLANLDAEGARSLLSAPKVLGDLTLGLPDNLVLDDALPTGLVSGDFVVLEGRYYGRAPSKISVRGRLGRAKISTSFAAKRRPKAAEVLVASATAEDHEQAVGEGLVLPSWYTPSMRRIAAMNLTQASRTGWQATGQLDSAIVHRQLRTRVLPRARACYNRALTRNQILSGEASLVMEMGKGEVMMAGVEGVELNFDDPKLVDCLEAAAWSMDVPAGNLDAQVYEVRYPLVFTAPEGGKAPQFGEQSDPMFQRLLDSADALSEYQNHHGTDDED